MPVPVYADVLTRESEKRLAGLVRDLVKAALEDGFVEQAARHLDVPPNDFRAAIGPLALPA